MARARAHGAVRASARTRRSPTPTCITSSDALPGSTPRRPGDLPHQDRARSRDVVLPAAAASCEGEGTVTNSERRVQRVRKAVDPPGDARDELWIIAELAQRLGHDWGAPTAEERVERVPRRRAALRRRHELRAPRGTRRHPVAVPRRIPSGRNVPPRSSLGSAAQGAAPRRSRVVQQEPPVEQPDAEFPLAADNRPAARAYNTGVQTGGYASPLHLARRSTSRPRTPRGSASPTASWCASSRAAARWTRRRESTRRSGAGMVFMTLHFPDEVPTNQLTIDASDPKSGTAEFKACAVRVESRSRSRRPRGPSLMDIRPVDAEPTVEERAAIDAFLGVPASSWDGGAAAPS